MTARHLRTGILLLTSLLAPTMLRAVEPVTLTHGGFADLVGGTGSGVSLHSDGRLTRAPQLAPLIDADADRTWDLLADDDGLWIASGDEGRLLRWDGGDDEPRIVLDSPEVSLHALAQADRGVFVGSSPDGLVYHVRRDGTTRTVAQTGAGYVWDLARDADALLIATGQPARVLRLDGEQTTSLLEATGDAHVRALARRTSGWVAGTSVGAQSDRSARIYALEQGRRRLLLETAYDEVTHLVARGDTLFAAVTRTPDEGVPAAAMLRIEPGGASWALWQGRGVPAGLLLDASGQLMLVLRDPGRLLRLQVDGSSLTQVAHIDSITPNVVARLGARLVLGDGASGRLLQLTDSRADSGWFEAPVRDLGAHGDWGRIDWEAGGEVQVRTRTGNSLVPDDTWSAWSAPVANEAVVTSPPGRYLQVRLRLRGDDAVVRRLSVTGRQTNLPPRLDGLTTFAYRGNPQAPGPPPPQPPNGSGNGRSLPQSKSLRLVRWQAADPNGDALHYRIYLRGEGQSTWKLVEEDVEATTVYWDTERMPEGLTRLRLVAHDGAANAAPLEDEILSEPFAIDNSPPVVRLTTSRDKGVVVVRARFEDAVTPVRGASWNLDYADHGPRLAATDGLYDSRVEEALLRLDDLPPGEHVIGVQAWDDLDNVGVARVVVRID
jgi:hypothetical protein